ncbi:expressed unknown protein [Seminavis robusta]|uniref:SPRY domain-containing protein n=1 Tax=Seminavis robusta TaxID=568900 RepID=A0A9N8F313_9STRA|nr:expressed unknown protein [Seminavis robusta]|eukprot:Sro3222_g345510.1 n/a (304) ;mRNA; f:1216-2127
MNSLHNKEMTWVGDGSDGNTLTQTGNDLVIASKSGGTPFNLRLDSEQASQDYYWQATIQKLKGNLSFGAVSKDGFKPGWKTKGMFYNGNLTNGSGALKVSWGPRFEVGDAVGVRVSPGESLTVTFYKNGECLGTGFRLSNNTTTFYPCLHVSGSASLSVEVPEALPSTELSTPNVTGFYGDWKLDKAWDGENPLTIPDDRPLRLELINEGSKIKMHFKIANNIGGGASILEQNETTMKVDCGPFMMSRMMPPPEFRTLENLIGTKKITTITLDDSNGTLTVTGPEMKTEWSRLIRAPEALNTF